MTAPRRHPVLKFLAGLLLLPLAAALTLTCAEALRILAQAPARLPFLHVSAAVAGAALWLLAWFLLPPFTKTYVLGHELTHALWTLFFGGRPSHLRIGEGGGSVRVSKTNVWVTLAPYFFPFYTVLVLLLWFLLLLLFPAAVRPWAPLALFLVGLTWCFHLTFTLRFLGVRQPDVVEHGRLFSYALIYTLNLLALTAAFVAAGTWTFPEAARDYLSHLRAFAHAAYVFNEWLLTRLPPL